MAQRTIKLLCSFLMVFCLMAPTVAPFCAQDWYKMVMQGGTNEEEQHEKTSESLKKLTEKDLFFYEASLLSLQTKNQIIPNFSYWATSETIVFDIPLPPPERAV